jgi:hypothetical protein
MPGPYPKALIDKLALHVAGGGRIASWARENGVPRRTCYDWSRRPEFQDKVEAIRRRTVDRAVGRMTRSLHRAVKKIEDLVEQGENDHVRLAAARTLIDKMLDVKGHAEFERQIAELRARIASLEANADENRDAKTPG